MSLTLLGSFFSCSSPPETDLDRITRYTQMSYQEMIAEIKTPEQVAWYIQHYIEKEDGASLHAYTFHDIHERRKGDCSEATVAAAALLSDDGYAPLVLFFRRPFDDKIFPRHVIFVYSQNSQWGSLGINGQDIQRPIYSTLEELALQFPFEEYTFEKLPVEKFPGWISGSENLNVRKKFFALSPDFSEIER